MSYRISKSEINFSSGTKITFKYEVNEEILEFNGVLIITLSIPAIGDWTHKQNEDYRRNVFGIDILNEKIVWQIENHLSINGRYHGPQISSTDPSDIFMWGQPDILINPFNGKVAKIIPPQSQWD